MTTTAPTAPKRVIKRLKAQPPKLSRQQKPADMTLEQWQAALRRQFGREQPFKLENVGNHPFFSEFRVTNPETAGTYRIVIRGPLPGDNSCACPDFAVNRLGTCKHIEFALAKLERRPGGRTALKSGFHPSYSEIMLKYGARREVVFRPGSDCPDSLARLASRYFGEGGILTDKAFAHFETFLAESAASDHEIRCNDDALGFVAEVRDAARRRTIIDKAFPRGIHSPAFKGLVKADLYDYQREGALFAARAGRCLIGDEMGLGKTIQAIAAAEIMAKHLGVARVLIVCPTSLKHQWEREIARFIGRSTCVISGGLVRRRDLYASDAFYKITNYDTVYRDLESIRAWSPDLVILDEAQRIKNWTTRVARNVKKIASPFAIVLTGTPLENRLQELVSIVQFVDQHRLGPTYRFLADHQIVDEHGRVIGYKDLDTIGKALAPILIRRRKDQVLKQLPERLSKNFFVPMTPQQMEHHEDNKEIVARIVRKWRLYHFLSEADQRRLMVALQNMRMSCDSTYLLDPASDHGVKADELATLLDEIYERPDTKVVIFSQWLRMHELIERRLEARRHHRVLFHGGVPGNKRGALIDRFRDDQKCRAFLSTDAGGVGLNLQHASVVVNMDLPWNPAVLEQRIGRVHRLGQSRPVQVVNFVSQGTIEEGMLGLLKFKSSLFSGALDGGEKEVFLGGTRLTQFIKTVEKATSAIPAADIEEAASPEATTPSTTPDGEAEAGTPASGLSPAQDQAEVSLADAIRGESPTTPTTHAPPTTTSTATPTTNTWAGLLQTGLSLLEQLAAAARDGGARVPADSHEHPARGVGGGGGLTLVRRDPATGEPYVHLPMPKPEVLERFLGAVTELLTRGRAP